MDLPTRVLEGPDMALGLLATSGRSASAPGLTSLDVCSFQGRNTVIPHYPVNLLPILKRGMYISSSFCVRLFSPSLLDAENETLFSWAHVILTFTWKQVTIR